ncbi:MAG: DoxX family protein [Alphaproteobacteria bacterium 65-7]|nr:MAG: DoxX family protein [Alphaproteobacteria bacterium 65-7]
MGFLDKFSYQILGITRIVAGLLFLEHGTTKFLNFPPGNMHPPLASLSGISGMIEIVTGVLIVLGFFSRPAAFLASGTMAFAYWLVHAKNSMFPVQNGGDAAILFCFLFLYLAAAGPGAFSINKK